MPALVQKALFDPSEVHDSVEVGSIVRCGPVGAVWRVAADEIHHDGTMLTLEPFDPNGVPLDACIQELPLPMRKSPFLSV